MSDAESNAAFKEYAEKINTYYSTDKTPKIWYPMFYRVKIKNRYDMHKWINDNNETFLKGTENKVLQNRWFYSEMGPITALAYAPNGAHIIVGHGTGLIQVCKYLRGNKTHIGLLIICFI